MGLNCPICSNRIIVKGVNDLITECPFIAKEWDYERNKDILPENYSKGSGKRVYWRCSICDNSFQREIRDHVQETAKCPKCKGELVRVRT